MCTRRRRRLPHATGACAHAAIRAMRRPPFIGSWRDGVAARRRWRRSRTEPTVPATLACIGYVSPWRLRVSALLVAANEPVGERARKGPRPHDRISSVGSSRPSCTAHDGLRREPRHRRAATEPSCAWIRRTKSHGGKWRGGSTRRVGAATAATRITAGVSADCARYYCRHTNDVHQHARSAKPSIYIHTHRRRRTASPLHHRGDRVECGSTGTAGGSNATRKAKTSAGARSTADGSRGTRACNACHGSGAGTSRAWAGRATRRNTWAAAKDSTPTTAGGGTDAGAHGGVGRRRLAHRRTQVRGASWDLRRHPTQYP